MTPHMQSHGLHGPLASSVTVQEDERSKRIKRCAYAPSHAVLDHGSELLFCKPHGVSRTGCFELDPGNQEFLYVKIPGGIIFLLLLV